MAHDVFISYSSNDRKIVEAVSHYLEQNRIRCFVAYRDIPKAFVWAKAITEAIESCRLMVVIFSEHFNRSEQVDREIEMCMEEGKPILTFRIQNASFTGAKKYYLKNINWIDAFPDPGNSFGELLKSILALLPDRVSDIDTEKQKKAEGKAANEAQARKEAEEKAANEAQARKEAEEKAEKDRRKTVETEEQIIEGNDSDYSIGIKHYKNQNYSEAVEWFLKAAVLGDANAQNQLGLMYEKGQGVKKDYSKAFEWYSKSADQGNTSAQYNLGVIYKEGRGVKRDYTKAVEWYSKSAEQGNANAQYDLGIMYEKGRGVTRDYTKAIEWYSKAGEQGFIKAQSHLGDMYYYGFEVNKDYLKAIYWYTKVTNQGEGWTLGWAQARVKELNKKLNKLN